MTSETMRKKEVARYLGICERSVDLWRDKGLLTGQKQINKTVLFDRAEVEALYRQLKAQQ